MPGEPAWAQRLRANAQTEPKKPAREPFSFFLLVLGRVRRWTLLCGGVRVNSQLDKFGYSCIYLYSLSSSVTAFRSSQAFDAPWRRETSSSFSSISASR